ncbi:MAG: polysaccharide biosynthesis tyrosine autokinase [Nitrospirae bacterium]|nr:polysaccharide biosynthesis tyrosine autokinase [Nitrospirota bacterium]
MNGQLMEEKEIHLRDYLRVIFKRRHTVFAFFAVVLVVVLIGTFSTTPIFMASTKVLIEKAESRAIMMNYSYGGYDPEFYATQYQLIKSSSVARRVVDMLGLVKTTGDPQNLGAGGVSFLQKFFGAFSEFRSMVFRTEGLDALRDKDDPEARADAIAKTISSGIIVSPVKNSKIVDITYMSPNPALAQQIANTVAKAYIEQLLEFNMSSAKYTLEWMTKKAEEERANVEKSEKYLQNFQKSQNFVTLENKVAIIPQKIAELNTRLISAESRKREMETLYNKVKEVSSNISDAENINVIASDPTLQSIRQQIIKSEQDISELSQKLGQKHPSLLRAKEDLASLKTKRDQEIRRVIESVKNDYELAKSNVASFSRLLAEAKGEALNLNEKAMEYGIISREVETNRQLYDALVKRVKEQSITDQIQTVNVLIVEKAELPSSPVKPKKAMNVLLGLLLGLFGGVGMAFFVEYLDQTVKSPDDVEAKVGTPVLGLIPLVKTGASRIETIVMQEPKSMIAENYRAVRTALLLSSAENPPKRILVTSAGPEEGKTSTSVNLATTIAQSGYSVLLIDADLRKPRINKVFGISNAKGLSTYLAGASDLDVICSTNVPNLSLLTSGPVPPNPSELLGSKLMVELLNSLGERFDMIICDSPPLLSVADSLILGNILDATIIVTRAGKTTYDSVRKAVRTLGDLKVHILGIVINALDVKKSDYYYYRYQNYYYASEETTEELKKSKPKKKT